MTKGHGRIDVVELEIDDHIMRVVDRSLDPMGPNAGGLSGVSKLVEGSGPDLEVSDGVLDVKSCHQMTVRAQCRSANPKYLGFVAPALASGSTVGDVSITAVCRSHGGDARSLRLALLEELRRSVAFDAYAWLLTDPATEVGTAPIADILGAFEELPRLIRLKYATGVNRWTSLDVPVARLHAATGGRLEHSLIWRELLCTHGVSDVMSIVFRDQYGCWSFLDLWRVGAIFTDSEAQVLTQHATAITSALRRCAAQTFATPAGGAPAFSRTGPLVLVLAPDLHVRAQTPETASYLNVLVPPNGDSHAVPAAAYNVAAQLLAAEDGIDDHPPVARVHLDSGRWLTLRAARIGDDIAVSIETTTPADRCELLSRATGLTDRETELLVRLANGVDTRTLAQQMFLSEHTVQDHLKAIFAKTGAGNRRDLLARASGR